MIKKEQVVPIVSIGLICFLIGTSVASDGGNPFDALWNAFNGLESRIEALENQSPPLGFMGAPAYDSGWQAVSPGGVICEHNLGTDELFVYMVGRWVNSDLHQMYNGGFAYYYDGEWYNDGASWWALSINQIQAHRAPDDMRWEEIRVYIWVIS